MTTENEKTWTTQELQEDFTVTGFCAPFVLVQEKETGKIGTLEFGGSPRLYSNFVEDK